MLLFETDHDEMQFPEEPECLRDLNLDQIVAAVTAERDEYQLKPFFYLPLEDVAAVEYRQAIFRDLEDRTLIAHLDTFAQKMRAMRTLLVEADRRWYLRHKQRGFLQALDAYCVAVCDITHHLAPLALRSQGLSRMRDYLSAYRRSEAFQTLLVETRTLISSLSEVQYRLHIIGARITVSRYQSDPDYSEAVLRTFEKFRQGPTVAYDFRFTHGLQFSQLQAEILERVALLFPEVFAALEQYCLRHRDPLNATVRMFDREIQFYLAYLEYIERLKRAGLAFCYPRVTYSFEAIECHEAFDLALAAKLADAPATPVTNDILAHAHERILVVSGANQGGKTTFARMIGQLHYLASLGCPVPGREAKLILFDRLFTHFEREEDLRSLRSKLEDDLVRVRGILDRATCRSLVVMNESFASSTVQDALFLSREILGRMIERGLVCVFVTFLGELASLGPSTVSFVATVKPEDPTQRTFKILRRPADGLAYALAMAAKHSLTYELIKQRLTA
jgi:DNA mismatch repair protein MutS